MCVQNEAVCCEEEMDDSRTSDHCALLSTSTQASQQGRPINEIHERTEHTLLSENKYMIAHSKPFVVVCRELGQDKCVVL